MTRTKNLENGIHTAAHRLHALLLHTPALHTGAMGALFFGAGCLLSLAQVFARPLPLALALVAALGFSVTGTCAYLGAAAGYLLFWGMSGALEFVSAGFLILAAAGLFGQMRPRDRRWFVPACAGALYLLPALTILLGGRVHAFDAVFLAAKILLLMAATAAFSDGLAEKAAGRGAIALALLAGAAQIALPGGLPLGAVLAAGAVFLFVNEPAYLLCAVSCGLVLDVTAPQAASLCALFSLAALVCHAAALQSKALRAGLFLGLILAGVLFAPEGGALVFVGAALGTLLALPLQLPPFCASAAETDTADAQALERMADVLMQLTRLLDHSAAFEPEPQAAAVFDHAAGQVCKNCGKYGVCWNERAKETYLALSSASARILQRGQAVRGDLPGFFAERCCRTSAFLSAVNEALDERQCRLQYQSRLRENRAILADQYRFLSRALHGLTTPQMATAPNYAVDLGFRASRAHEADASGDHSRSFQHGEWFYVLLCDGMGTGAQAQTESSAAAGLLQSLIQSGFDAPDAMEVLNGIYILRTDGGFSTVDLLQISLVSAEGYLYKWGAPCSYLIDAGEMQKIGTAAPPPGVGVGEKHRAECVKLSLQRGQMLVLVSDGISDTQITQCLAGRRVTGARELAAGILSCAGQEQTDDQTAVALRLRPCSTRKKHNTAQEKILSK